MNDKNKAKFTFDSLSHLVRESLEEKLGRKIPQGTNSSLAELGLDSLQVTEATTIIEDKIGGGVKLANMLVFTSSIGDTLDELTTNIAKVLIPHGRFEGQLPGRAL